MSFKKLLQQEKQHVLVSPKSYFLLILLALTGVLFCVFELSLLFQSSSTLYTLQITALLSLAITVCLFALLWKAKSDLLDNELIVNDDAEQTNNQSLSQS